MVYRMACGLVAAAILACWCEAQDKPEKKSDAEAIQGVWKITHFEEQGKVEPPEKFKSMVYVFMDGKATIKVDGKAVVEGKYKLDPSKDPKHIDLKLGDEDGPGIYKLDGNKLTICAPAFAAKAKRPKEFKAPKDSRLMLMKFERV
jgi:uncharacterized protein (TIGR03067 family)